jgi:hypothetical protein
VKMAQSHYSFVYFMFSFFQDHVLCGFKLCT